MGEDNDGMVIVTCEECPAAMNSGVFGQDHRPSELEMQSILKTQAEWNKRSASVP